MVGGSEVCLSEIVRYVDISMERLKVDDCVAV
jgi:hypothetical protein